MSRGGHNRKLTPETVKLMRSLFRQGWTLRALGAEYGVSNLAAMKAIHGDTYKDVPNPVPKGIRTCFAHRQRQGCAGVGSAPIVPDAGPSTRKG